MKPSLAFTLLILLAGCAKSPPPPVEAAPAKDVAPPSSDVELDAAQQAQAKIETVPVSTQNIAATIQVSGRLVVNEQRTWHVGSVIDGRVVRLMVNIGDRVNQGQVLAGLHTHDIHESRADYRKALAELSRLKSQVSFTQKQRDRAKRLYDLKAGSLDQLEHADADLKNSQTALTNAEIEVERTRRHITEFLQIAIDDHDDHEPGESIHESDLVLVKSPASATVLQRKVSVGSVAKSGDELFEIADLSTVWMIANVPEEHLRALRLNSGVKVNIQAFPDQPLRGRITKIGDQMDPETRTIPTRVEIPNPTLRLKPEMYATAEIPAGGAASSILIPQTAIQQVQGHAVVFIKKSATAFEPRAVRTGNANGNFIEVLDGLSNGETIVTSGSFILKSRLLKKSLEEE